MTLKTTLSRWLRRDAPPESVGVDASAETPFDGDAVPDPMPAPEELPVVWLLGKTGSGKSSIVSALTGASQVEIGQGFVPCTRTARVFDFPPEQPLLRILDTRGLGEKGYDPDEDLAINEARAHLLILTLRVRDDAQDALIRNVHEIRRRHPNWPLIVAQTGLHDLYDGTDDHPADYPFAGTDADDRCAEVPRALRAALKNQRDSLERLPGVAPLFVPLDLTRTSDGYTPADYGRDALIEAILRAAPDAAATIAALQMRRQVGHWKEIEPQAHRLILSLAAGASGAGMVPVVGVGTVVVAHVGLVWALARHMQVPMTRKDIVALFGMLGTATLVRQGALLGLRQIAKIAPFLIPVMAVQDYAVTYALGRAAYVYLRGRQQDIAVDADAVKAAFRQGLAQAFAFRSDKKGAAS